MSCLIFCSLLLMIASTFAIDDPKDAIVTNYEFTRGTSNKYHFGFDSSDGTSRQENGRNGVNDTLAIDGTVSWVAKDGSRYQMTFKADNKGFRPIIKRISGP